jgi:hypothetical protein
MYDAVPIFIILLFKLVNSNLHLNLLVLLIELQRWKQLKPLLTNIVIIINTLITQLLSPVMTSALPSSRHVVFHSFQASKGSSSRIKEDVWGLWNQVLWSNVWYANSMELHRQDNQSYTANRESNTCSFDSTALGRVCARQSYTYRRGLGVFKGNSCLLWYLSTTYNLIAGWAISYSL